MTAWTYVTGFRAGNRYYRDSHGLGFAVRGTTYPGEGGEPYYVDTGRHLTVAGNKCHAPLTDTEGRGEFFTPIMVAEMLWLGSFCHLPVVTTARNRIYQVTEVDDVSQAEKRRRTRKR